jgi:hypothetical protein
MRSPFDRDVLSANVMGRWEQYLFATSLLLAVVSVLQGTFPVGSDTATYYMRSAVHLYNGEPYTHVYRGPVFPLTILWMFQIFGLSAASLMWLVRLYVVGSVVLTYLLGSELFSRSVGAIAVVFLTTSGAMYGFGLNEIDGVFAFWQLLAVLLFVRAVRRGGVVPHLVAGVAIGLTFLTKETGLLLVPLPVVVYVIRSIHRDSTERRDTVACYVALLLTVVPWALYVFSIEGSLTPILGLDYTTILRELLGVGHGGGSGSVDLVGRIVGVGSGLAEFYDLYVRPYFSVAPMFLVAWVVVAYRALRYWGSEILLVATAGLHLPVLLFTVRSGFRPGQVLFVYYLSFLALAAVVVTVAERIQSTVITALLTDTDDESGSLIAGVVSGDRHRVLLVIGIVLLLTTPTSAVQFVSQPQSGAGVVENSVVVDGLMGETMSTEFGGVYGNPGVQTAAQWFDGGEYLDSLVFPNSLYHELYFRTDGRIRTTTLPMVFSIHEGGQRTVHTPLRDGNASDTADEHILFVGPHHDVSRSGPVKLRVLTQEDLLTRIEKSNLSYVTTNSGENFLTAYFRAHPGFSLVFSSDRVRIFQRTGSDLQPIEYPTYVEDQTRQFFAELKQSSPETYTWYRDRVLTGYYGFNDSQARVIQNGSYGPYFAETEYDPIFDN